MDASLYCLVISSNKNQEKFYKINLCMSYFILFYIIFEFYFLYFLQNKPNNLHPSIISCKDLV